MSEGSRRTRPLPPGWQGIRAGVLARDGHACQWPVPERPGGICGDPAREVDHISDPEDHSPANLRSLCHPHHASQTGRDAGRLGGLANGVIRREVAARKYRQPERHPGYKRADGE